VSSCPKCNAQTDKEGQLCNRCLQKSITQFIEELPDKDVRAFLRSILRGKSSALIQALLNTPEMLEQAGILAPLFHLSGIDADTVRNAVYLTPKAKYQWWHFWPISDTAGRQIWARELVDVADQLEPEQLVELTRHLQGSEASSVPKNRRQDTAVQENTPANKSEQSVVTPQATAPPVDPPAPLDVDTGNGQVVQPKPQVETDRTPPKKAKTRGVNSPFLQFITSPALIAVLVGMLAIVVMAMVFMVSKTRDIELKENLFLTVDGALTREHIEVYDDLVKVMGEDPVAGWKDFNDYTQTGQLIPYNRQLKNVWDMGRNPCKTLDSALKHTRRLIRVAESVKRDGIPHRHLALVEAYLGWIGQLQAEGRITVDGTYLSLLATTVPAICETPEKGYVIRHSISGSPEYVTIRIGPEDEDTPITAKRVKDTIERERTKQELYKVGTAFSALLERCREPDIAAHLELDLEALERRINDSLIGVEVITNQVTIYKEAVQELNSAISSSEARRKSVEDRNAKKAKYEKLYEENRPLLEAYRKECGLSSVEGTFDRAKGEQDPNTAAGLFQSAYSGLVTALANAQAADRDKKEKELAASFNEVKQRYDDALSKVRSLPSTKEQEANLGKAKNLVTQAEGNRDIEKLRNAADLVEEVVKQQEGLRDGYLAAQKLYNEKAKEVSTRRLLSVRGEAAKGKWGQAQSEANAAMQYENRLEGVKRYNTAIALLEEILAEKPDAAKPIEKKEDEEPKLRHKDTTDRVFKRNEKDTSTQTASIKDLTKAAEDARKEREKKKKGWFGKTVGAVGGAVKSTGKMMAAPVVKTKDALVDYKNRDLSFYAAITKIEVEFDRTITNPTDVMVLFSWETGTYTATQRSVDFSGKMKPAESVLEVPGINKLFGMDGRVLDYRIRCTVTLQQSGAKKKFSRTGAWILEGGKFRQGENGDWLDLEMLKKADAKDPNDALAEVSKVRVFVQSRDPE